MSLPNGFLDDLRTRLTLSQIVGKKVTWDMRKSNQAKGDYWAPCPFHQEKSASFHVDDRKGFYYCFGCHAKGDAIGFVKEIENLSFMEAVEVLAREAGMQIPARDPQAAAQADRRSLLVQVMEEVVKFYRLQLKTAAGAEARRYLADKRRLSEAALERWEIGWAPDGFNALRDMLAAKGVSPELMVASGMVAKSDTGQLYDRFRGRIIFPIRDGRGRAISLGGRSLDPNAQAKYLNGPETELFDKGRSLFNQARAREAAGKGKPLIVAEGYMDVIALSEAGFPAAVAPLGTAVTDDQLRLIWRIADEPIIALDGDKAGLKAAERVVDLALPLIEAGKGLRFAVLPPGLDPDDLIKTHGTQAMQSVLDAAIPMVELLWKRETAGHSFDSPERKAALRLRLRTALNRIRDPDIKRYYAEALRNFEFLHLSQRDWLDSRRGKRKAGVPGGASEQAKASMLARLSTDRAVEYMRETSILAICLRYPEVIGPVESSLETLEMLEDGHSTFLQLLLQNHLTDSDQMLYSRICERVGTEMVERLMLAAHIIVLPPIKNVGDRQGALFTVAEQLAKLRSERALRKEIEEGESDIAGLADEGVTWRVGKAAEARRMSEKVKTSDSADLGEDRAALSRHLQSLIDSEVWVKKNR